VLAKHTGDQIRHLLGLHLTGLLTRPGFHHALRTGVAKE